MSAGWLGPFPPALTTGYQNIGAAQKSRTAFGWLGAFPAGLTTGYRTIGAVEKQEAQNFVDTFSDSVTAADSFVNSLASTLTFSDSLTSADSQAVTLSGVTIFSDSLTGSDTQSSSLAAVTTFSDPVTGSDTMSGTISGSNTFSDSVTASDSFQGGIGYTFTFSDSVTATDMMLGVATSSNTFSDSITAADAMSGGIGYTDFFSDSITATDLMQTNPQPNIILTGTLDFGRSFRIQHQINTYLNFGIIIGDDNLIKINVLNIATGAQVFVDSATINFYAPNNNVTPILTMSALSSGLGFFQFALGHVTVSGLTPGLYAWKAQVIIEDGTIHTVNCGDINLSTGIMTVFERP